MEFRVLGPLEVWRDDCRLELGGRKQRALLAVLLLRANEVISTERLIDELWGEHPPPRAKDSLQNIVGRLRRLLGSTVLETRPPGYVLNAATNELDLARFERLVNEARHAEAAVRSAKLREAPTLWRGQPFGELALEGFARPEIAREGIGIVEAVGADVRTVKVGDVVVIPSAYSDGTCTFCHEGLHTSCIHGGFFGTADAGAQAEGLRVPQADGTLLVLPVAEDDALLPSLLTLSDVMGTGHHAAIVAKVGRGRTVAVVGDGAVGCAG